ncbi:ABC transporter ATP-binding protein [Caldilinea sp.]|uniref:ABC transporter ATP-binding protein n=1 Tax=Caldilinea sp. TaxID=2293560 RepID=UPI002C2BE49F|nr:ABC transporter ATP-binding protein [Caldilinea sp.]HRA68644.1 ABC transporter ATP-binding protein [Caldilinea sp.]
MLDLHNVHKRFGRLAAVAGVSLRVEAGEIVGLIGPNGSGKSTLLSTIAGAYCPDDGEILLDDQPIGGLAPDQIFARGLARSYQDPSLFFRMSALDNALLPARGQRGEKARHAPFRSRWWGQERAHVAEAAAILSDLKLEARAQTPASDLSGGQMKLLEIGRTLMGEPRLLLLDEPTAGVAPGLAYTIFEEIERMRAAHGLSFLIVEHRLEILFDFVDRLYVMHLGQVIAEGKPAEIEQNARVREVYFGA